MSLEDNADDWAKNEADEVVTRPSDSGAAPSYISALAASNPYRPYEWYLDGYLTPGGNAYGADVDAISTQYRGAGVKVGIIDEGFDYRNPDLVGRFDLAASYDPRNPGTQSILPDSSDAMHGTWVSGVIGAAADNNFGTVGVASAATLVGFYARFGSGGSPRAELADLLARQVNDDIANNSWGYTTQFADNFLDPAWSNIRDAIQLGVTEGRGGLGTNYVFAAGNDRQYVPNSLTSDGDNTNDHSLTNTRHDIAVAATTQTGHFTSFSTPGASVLVAAPGESMLTTAPYDGRPANDYAFVSGTSFSAPTVSGVIADMLQANPLLGYRDVQEILAMSARKIDEANSSSWAFNGDNHWNGGADTVSSDYGYGLVDAHAAVRLAETWTIQNNLTKGFGSATAANEGQIDVAGSAGGAVSDMFGYAVPVSYAFTVGSDYSQFHVSRVDLDVSLTTGLGLSPGHLGDLKVELVSPTGTHSILLDQPGAGTNTRSSLTWTFDTTHDFGESPVGTWTVEFSSIPNDGKVSIVNSLALHVYGDSEPAANDVYYFTDQYHDFYDAGRSTITDYSGVNTVNASMVTSNSHIDLRNGYASTIDGETVHLNGIVNVFAGDGNDTLIGNDANDTFWTGTGVDTVHGGAGDDTIYVNNSSDVITDTGGYNTVWSSVDYTLPTGIQQLNLTGPASSGVGNDAGDLFRNETNHNVTFTGGTGNDSYDVGTGDTILERSGGGIDTVCLFKGTDSSYTIPANVENLSILSPISSLTAIGGTSSGNVIDASNLGHGAWIYGGAGNDTITGSSSGQNVIEGGPGADVLHGGPIDILSYVHSDFPVYVNLGNHVAFNGDAEGDTITGFGSVFGSLVGGDTIFGDSGDNYLQAGPNSYLNGGPGGNDTFEGGAGDTLVGGGGGFNWVWYDQSSLPVWVNLATGHGSSGAADGDSLYNIQAVRGSPFSDALWGNRSGETVLDGGGGNDLLVGMGGVNYYECDGTTWGYTEIWDFAHGTDKIAVSSAAFADFAAISSHMSQVGRDTVIAYDAGDTIKLDHVNHSILTASDFLIC